MELQIAYECELSGVSVNESLMRAVYFQCNFMAKGCVGLRVALSVGLLVLNDTGMLMYDIAASFPNSFPHMVNSFSQQLSGQFTEHIEGSLPWGVWCD